MRKTRAAWLEQKLLHRLARLHHQMELVTAWPDRLLFYAPAAGRKLRADTGAVKPPPMFFNLKEEIGWKAPLQNSNLLQEVV